MMKVVISQPMFFPWVGLFEQIRLADIYVHYDDVQMPQGRSFINRVQIKTDNGVKWLTVPLRRSSSNILIKDSYISYEERWMDKHLKFLHNIFLKAPFKNEMLNLVEMTYQNKFETISELNIFSLELVSKYFGIENTSFSSSSNLGLETTSSQHLLDIVKIYKGDTYISGWGAINYLDYSIFENNNIDVCYMDYLKKPYKQLYGQFTPFVSILDLIANEGVQGVKVIQSNFKPYKLFLHEFTKTI